MNEQTVLLEHTGFPPLMKEEVEQALKSLLEDPNESLSEKLVDAVMFGYIIAARKVTGATV